MNSYLQSVDIFKTLRDARKPLILVGILSLLASIIFSGPSFIKPRFKSEAILYPSNLIAYSEESPTEQMIQLLQSTDVRDAVIKAFNLYGHYNVDSVKNKVHQTLINQQYNENVSINKTEYESVDITVYDTDPAFAAAMIDSMIVYMNEKARTLQREKSQEVLIIARRRLDLKKMELDSLEYQIQEYRTQYGLLDYKTQAKEYARAYARSLQSGSARAISESKKMLETLGDKGGEFNALNEHVWRIRGTYNDLKLEYESALKDVTKKLTYGNLITRPIPADKKSTPIRWLIVVISVSSTLFLAFLVILFLDSNKQKAVIH